LAGLLTATQAQAEGWQPLPPPTSPTITPDTSFEEISPGAVASDDSKPQGFWETAGSVMAGNFVDWRKMEPNVSGDLPWMWQVVPTGLVWRSYLAGIKESRLSVAMVDSSQFGTIWDAMMGGRVSLLRYGTPNAYRPEGFEVQIEANAQPRIWPNKFSAPLIATDYQVGVPIVYSRGQWQFKTGYHHLSSHLGDEYMILNPTATRINYMRDSWMFAVGYYYTDNLRLYGEVDYAFAVDGGAQPIELQFGFDWSPAVRGGAPFFATYCDLRQELDYGGYFVVQTGWQWRGGEAMKTFRLGAQYVNGKNSQYEFYNDFEQQVGFGIWYDY
jgi:hypothetical protein